MLNYERFRDALRLSRPRMLRQTQFDDRVFSQIGPKRAGAEQSEVSDAVSTHPNDPYAVSCETPGSDPVYRRR